ncbi:MULTISPECIES: 50S ribosomal protein L4 [Hallerella]|jgi:large subunit ribosomal protein L4|uniref:Large ribosomal subunit protein uL4 n=1 Tax=Hallerella succinigenes TaxID=1896222 RepID=A0A2M9A704_9BACT|nr:MULTISPECIES: 50S ribosomal protein L4 [Hallerella]MBS7391282.1 50S ribosomal protein L4 [Fibrobacter sp.]MCI6872619.1 50S ribosomal protein L4 [Hallerella sp.]MDD6091708.1 50S ribosomal protein L4 [Hallerella succinigenes]MDY5028200.1 50S ribosomal protein L4 [Hallerella succinigenes]PJJ41495.1 LSU ribosomal protein L4P [Hallerella succinigenes]
MAKAKLYAASGEFKNEIDLPAVFDTEVNKVCIYLHIKAILNNRRQGTAQTKTRSQVSGGTTKPWKQKGTGRARAGQNTSAIWVRGNKAHGPKSHDYFEKVNKKVKRLAFHSALSDKAQEGKILVFESLSFETPKTKDFLSVVKKAGLEQRNALFLVGSNDKNLRLSSANVPWVRTARVQDVNTYDLVRANNIAISQEALGELTGGSR